MKSRLQVAWTALSSVIALTPKAYKQKSQAIINTINKLDLDYLEVVELKRQLLINITVRRNQVGPLIASMFSSKDPNGFGN